MQDALNTALAAIAGNTRSRLKSLALHCPTSIQPNVRVLRRLCSSAHQLSLSANELLLMAWGTDALYSRVWKAHSVESFVLPAPSDYLINKLIIATLATSLPSCTHLHVDNKQEASSVSTLLLHLGSRLSFLRCDSASLLQLPSAAISCIALVSLCIFDRHPCESRIQQVTDVFRCLTACASLVELTIIACGAADVWPEGTAYYTPLPQLRHLHIHNQRGLCNDQMVPRYANLTPSLIHLALVLIQGQPVSLFDWIDTQRLPLLTHLHVGYTTPSLSNREWAAAVERLKVRMSAVWCEKEDDVARWRADRVWRRSLGLPDEADSFQLFE